ncbi:hypothetical protein HNR42_000130 [Deinobacterium chartae]|uniref:GerMN domain-containing protein n=1 Tax=Deinobacterium chartae TaxID=521158 RepID=A0A841HXR9_9DEIO|nr:GerMN domain-containing protein [Deinobacterium chartae]MBB6096718.1 hypothetical protein [Deinobacterium chartae]
MKKLLTPFNIIAALLLLLAGGAYFWAARPAPIPEPAQRNEQPRAQAQTVALYFSDAQAERLRTERRSVQPEARDAAALAQAALAALVSGPRNPDLVALVPKDSQTPQVYLRGTHYYVDLPDAYGKLRYGSSGETMLVCGIVRTLLDLPPASSERDVTFLVDGENAETLLGHMDLQDPFRAEDCPVQ